MRFAHLIVAPVVLAALLSTACASTARRQPPIEAALSTIPCQGDESFGVGTSAIWTALHTGIPVTIYLVLRGAGEGAWWGAVTGGSAGHGAWVGAAVGAGLGVIIGALTGAINAYQGRHAQDVAIEPCTPTTLEAPPPAPVPPLS